MGLFVCFCVSLLPVVLLVLLFFSKKLLVKKLADSGASLVWGVCARCWRRGGPQKRRRQRRERSRKSARERERDKRRARTPGGGERSTAARRPVCWCARPSLGRGLLMCVRGWGGGGGQGGFFCVCMLRARAAAAAALAHQARVSVKSQKERERKTARESYSKQCACVACVHYCLPHTGTRGKHILGDAAGKKRRVQMCFGAGQQKEGGEGGG